MTAAARWRNLVRARLAEMERLEPGRGTTGPDYWNARRARRFADHMNRGVDEDPLLARLRRQVGRRSSFLDVGAGTGRFALALAPRVAHVTAVDPSPPMLAVLKGEARRRGISNVDCVTAPWREADVSRADVSLCSFVLPLIEDAAGFLAKLDAVTDHRCFVYMNGASGDVLIDPFWRHFHGRSRRPSPTYLDAVDVLEQIGVRADVEVVPVRTHSHYTTLAAAAKAYREMLVLPDTAAVRAELRRLLASWLVEQDGRLRPPVSSWPAAVISWGAAERSGGAD